MKRVTLLAALLASASFAVPAHAADITSAVENIAITGEIIKGDFQKFKAISDTIPRGTHVTVWLESPGGLIKEGLAIGDTIRRAKYDTMVAVGSKVCASVCGLIWLAGTERVAFPDSKIGFHAAFVEKPYRCWLLFTCATVEVSSDANALVGAYLQRLNFGPTAIQFLTSTAPDSMKWLDMMAAKKAGIAITMLY